MRLVLDCFFPIFGIKVGCFSTYITLLSRFTLSKTAKTAFQTLLGKLKKIHPVFSPGSMKKKQGKKHPTQHSRPLVGILIGIVFGVSIHQYKSTCKNPFTEYVRGISCELNKFPKSLAFFNFPTCHF